MKVLRYESSLALLYEAAERVIFLAGPTVRGNQPHLTSWRFAAIEEFARQGFDGILVVPEFTEKTESDKGKLWIPKWEYSGLCACDVIMFWVPRTRELIGLTTNHEHGYWLGREPDKMVYGRPDESFRTVYLDMMWQLGARESFGDPSSRPIFNTLEATIAASIERSFSCLRAFRNVPNVTVESPYGEF